MRTFSLFNMCAVLALSNVVVEVRSEKQPMEPMDKESKSHRILAAAMASDVPSSTPVAVPMQGTNDATQHSYKFSVQSASSDVPSLAPTLLAKFMAKSEAAGSDPPSMVPSSNIFSVKNKHSAETGTPSLPLSDVPSVVPTEMDMYSVLPTVQLAFKAKSSTPTSGTVEEPGEARK